MNIREIRVTDLPAVSAIHKKYYGSEFNLPDFTSNFLCVFVVTNDQDQVISVAGVRTIAEVVALTDKSKYTREKYKALIDIFQASSFTAARFGYTQLHAFTQDDIWTEQLLKKNWNYINGTGLVYPL